MKFLKMFNTRKTLLLSSTLLAALLSTAPQAKAESEGGSNTGGGDAVHQSGTWSLLDLQETLPYNYILPFKQTNITYEAKPLAFEALGIIGEQCGVHNHLTSDRVSVTSSRLADILYVILTGDRDITNITPNFGFIGPVDGYMEISKKFGQLVFVGTDSALEEVPDEGTIRYSDPESKKQVAVQKEGVVMLYLPIALKFDAKNYAALMVHESLVRFIKITNPNHLKLYGTSYIRRLVNMVFTKDSGELPISVFEPLCGNQGILIKN